MTDKLPRSALARQERARGDFVKGVVRPDAPGRISYPSLPELAATYDLVLDVLVKTCRDDDWLDARAKAMTYSAIVPFDATVDADPVIVKRAEVIALAMEDFDDKVFRVSERAMVLIDKAIIELEAEEDPVRAIRALRSISQTMESLHRTAKVAYDPASVRPDNTVNINVANLAPTDDVVSKVAQIYARMEQEALARGVSQEVIDGEIVEDEGV